ncbi:MAG: ATP-binding protein [Synergistaceae bacterium]|nr:ATP-binding protein [Synergistaceae bacterium]
MKNRIDSQLDELLKFNNYMKLLMDNTSVIFMLLDRNGHVLYCSDSIADMLEIKGADEIIGKPIQDVLSIFDNKALLKSSHELHELFLSGEDNFTVDYTISLRKKGKRYFRAFQKFVQSSEDGFRGSMLVLRDLTDELIQEENRQIAERLEATQMPCFVWDERGNMVNCNKKALVVFGLPDTLIPGVDKFSFSVPKYQPDGSRTETLRRQFIIDTIKEGYSQVEVVLNRADGAPFHVDITGVRISWLHGHRLFVYLRDLTEMKIKEAAAREAEERIRIMLDSNPLICILRDDNNNIIDCNLEALKLFGFTNKEDLIANFSKFYPEYQPDGQRTTAVVDRAFKKVTKNNPLEYEWVFQMGNGEPLPVKSKLVLISWKGVDCFLSYSRDLRQEKANEQIIRENVEQKRKLELQKEMAQTASEAKSQFLASMSHEIRTPMNTIIGLLDLMRINNLDAEQQNYIKDVKRMSSVLLQIINDILDFHKIESGKLEFLPIHFNLFTFFNDLASRHKFLAESKHLAFKSNFAADLPRAVQGDELRIGQVITNLLSNAIKYTRNGYVEFNVDSVIEDEKEYIVFTVEDSGIGIKEEDSASIFYEFEQFDLQKNRGITGTGLGLPIAKRLAEMMGGHIKFQSEYNKGSVFSFSLPLIKGNLDKIESPGEIKRVMAGPDAKVLVADDNAGNIIVAFGLLARHGIVPDEASNGIQAVEMVMANKYDLVFMDHMMPDMDGVEATKIIRKLEGEYYSNLPIIALSANAIDSAKELFYGCGMNDFVSKPINGNELNQALLRWLPNEKILEQKSEEEIPATPDEEPVSYKMLEELVKIKDLNVADGLSRIKGDKKLYRSILWQFCNSAGMDVSALKKYVGSGQWRDYTIKIHGLKTVFANIGNQFMSDWALSLEQAAIRGDIDKCINDTNNFCSALIQLNLRLKSTELMKSISCKTYKRKISPKELKRNLKQLLSACSDFHAETAEQIVNELSGVTYNTKVDALLAGIRDVVLSFDYDKAAETINELMKSLQSTKL